MACIKIAKTKYDSLGVPFVLPKTNISYHADTANKNILASPKEIVVSSNGNKLRQRTSSIDPNTGNVLEIRQHLDFSSNDPSTQAIFNMAYDGFGNLTKITRPNNYKNERYFIDYAYDTETHSFPIGVEDAFGYSSSSTIDYRFGVPLSTTDLNGQVIDYTYDGLGRMLSVKGPLCEGEYDIKNEYFSLDRYAKTSHYANRGTDTEYSDIVTITTADGLGAPIQVKKTASLYQSPTQSTEGWIVSGVVLKDAFGRATTSYHPTSVTSEISDYLPVDGNSVLASTSEYDVLDRATQVTLNDGSITQTAYSLDTAPQGNTQYKVSVTDANGTTSHSFTDVRERTLAVISPDPNGGNITTKYSYDALNQLREVIDNQGNVISSSYDNLGRRTSVTHPDAGLTTLEYDLSGNLLSRQTPNTTTPNPSNGGGSQKIKYFYEFNRLQKITYPYNWQNTVEYHYGEAGAPFNRAGRLVLITDASGGQEFRYDALGNITSQLRSVMIDPARVYAYTTTYEYDSWGRIQQMTYPDGENLSYAYNVAGNLTGIKGEKLGLTQTYIETVGYDEFEQKVYQKLGNGTETTYSYEADRRRLQNMQVTSPFNQTTLINNNYTYDRLSNVLSVQNTATPKPGQLGGSSQNSYQYDILNRLVSATGSFSGIDESANYSLNMQYDDLHNIQNKSVSQTSSINAGSSYNNAYQYSKTPHAPTKVGEDLFSYDANGNQTYHKRADGSFSQYKWDEENRMMASDNFGLVAQYTYDASGERVIKSSAENQKTIFINGAPAGYTYHNDNYTAYVGGHFEVKEGRFTKHYFNGAERLASKIGVGTLDNSAAKGYYQAGGIDYGKRYADAYKDFKQIAKEQGLPPGPPNLKFIYAQQALADQRANSELVANLTLLNNLSLAEWEQQNTDKDPGPPICDDVFCGTGGDINSGTLPENDIYFFHPDHLGSTSYITNIAGETVQFNSYLPFGESFVSQRRTTTISAYLFNGKEQDPETGLYYYGARYYNSKTSNWLSVDPIALYDPIDEVEHYLDGQHNGGYFNPRNTSVYGYTYQNPVIYVDPNGKQALAGAIIGAFTEYISIVGEKMIFDDMSFSQANQDLNWADTGSIGISFGVGFVSGSARFAKFMSSSTGQRIIKEVAAAGIENFMKLGVDLIMKNRDITKEDAMKLVVGTLTEVGLGKLLPKPAKGNLDNASDIVDKISSKTSSGGFAKKVKLDNAKMVEQGADLLNKAGKIINETATKTTSKAVEKGVENK